MATAEAESSKTSTRSSVSTRCTSYSTAIVILPPESLHKNINILRSVYDKSYPRWAPHITMAIPFVSPSELGVAVEQLRTLLNESNLLKPWDITFSHTEVFQHKDSATVYLKPDEYSEQRLRMIRDSLNTIFNLPSSGDGLFRPHLTIGQVAANESVFKLQEKAEMLLPISWTFNSLTVISKNEKDEGKMEVFASIPESEGIMPPTASSQSEIPCCYTYDNASRQYTLHKPSPSLFDVAVPPSKLMISTYNILHSPHQPQTQSSPRLPLLLNIILNQPSTLIILQEVTDTAWQYFLSNRSLRKKFPFISAPSHLPLPNHRNIVLLSKLPFKAHHLPLCTAHKPALIIDIEGLIIAGVHLHAGLHEEKLALKFKELSKLSTHLESTAKPVIIAGDFNIPSVQREYTAALPKILELLERYSDAWKEKPCENGDTFTPDTNRFAKEGAKVLYPQRHDRVYFSKGVGIHVEGTSLFGFPENDEELASDHWGLTVDLRIDLEKNKSEEVAEVTSLDIPVTSWTEKEMLTVLMEANQIPDIEHDIVIKGALTLLNSILSPTKQHLPFKLQAVGSFALGAHTRGSDLDIMAVSTISQKTFWEVFLQDLQRYKLSDPTNRVKVLRIIRNSKMPLVELLIDTCRIEIVYCTAGRLLAKYSPIFDETKNDSWDQLSSLPPSSDLFHLPAPTLDVLVCHRDNLFILSAMPNIETFRLARRAFKYFCSRRGIYGAKFGFLGGFAVTMLIAGICKCLPADTSASDILAAALSRYAEFPWESEILWFPGVEKGNVNREDRAAMYVPSITRAGHNIMRNASRSTMSTIRREISIAKNHLSVNTFKEVCKDGIGDMFLRYKNFIKVHCAFWGGHSAEGRKWISWIESRLVILLVNLTKEFPSLETRLWPARFADITMDDVQATYLVGVSGTGIDEGAFRSVLRDMEGIMKGEETEVVDRWVSVTLARGRDILAENLQADTRIWDGEEDIVLDREDDDEEDEEFTLPSVAKLTITEKTGKLRPSHDIFNRLVWDTKYSVEEYVVGYEDRFKGVKEMPLSSWKRECTDEEFIPFHRVVYFKEKGLDGQIVWDRRTRVDLIFGSGQKS